MTAKESSIERAVVTGGYGFIGSNLVRTLCDRGVAVTVVDSMDEAYGANPANLDSRENLTVYEADVRNKETIREAVSGADVVFHLAAQLSRPRSLAEPARDIDINCKGTVAVLEAVRELSPEARVVFTGSQAEFGVPADLPLTEDVREQPIDIYGANKLAAEHYCRVYRQVHDVDATTVCLTNVYGPKADLQNVNYGVINKFLRLALEDDELTVFQPGDMKRDPVFIDDVVRALVAVARTPSSARTQDRYVIGSGKPVTIHELAELIVETVGAGEVTMTPWPDDWDSIRVGDIYVDPAAAAAELNWEAEVELGDGLERTVSFYRQNWDDYLE